MFNDYSYYNINSRDMSPLKLCRLVFKFAFNCLDKWERLLRQVGLLSWKCITGHRGRWDRWTPGRDRDYMVSILFSLRREHCVYTVKQSRNAAVVLIINIHYVTNKSQLVNYKSSPPQVQFAPLRRGCSLVERRDGRNREEEGEDIAGIGWCLWYRQTSSHWQGIANASSADFWGVSGLGYSTGPSMSWGFVHFAILIYEWSELPLTPLDSFYLPSIIVQSTVRVSGFQ